LAEVAEPRPWDYTEEHGTIIQTKPTRNCEKKRQPRGMCIAIAHCKEEIQFKKSGFLQLVLAALRFGKTNRIRPYPAQTQNSKNKKNEKNTIE